LKLEKAC